MPSLSEPTKIYAGCIAEFQGIWDGADTLIPMIEEESKKLSYDNGFKQASIIKNEEEVKTRHRTNSHLGLKDAAKEVELFRHLNNSFFLAISSALQWYQKKFDIDYIYHNEGYNLLRYQTGQEYKAHFDGGLTDNRAVSPIFYLNDDYKGGELEFVHFDLKIKPKKNTLYLFPSNYAYSHIAHPVTEGTKYAIVTWLHGREK